MLADPGVLPLWNRPTQLNRQIGDAPPRIERRASLTWDQSLGRTSIDTARASPTTIRWRCARLQIERRDDLAKKKPRPERLIDQTSILADPSQSSLTSQAPLQHRSRIHADFVVKRFLLQQASDHPIQPRLDHIVIVRRAPRVPCDASRSRSRCGIRCVVQLAHANHRTRRRQQLPHILPLLRPMVREIPHFACIPTCDPRLITLKIRNRPRRSHARQLETALPRHGCNSFDKHEL